MIELSEKHAELRAELEKVVRNAYEPVIQKATDKALEGALAAIGIEEEPLEPPKTRKPRSDKGKPRKNVESVLRSAVCSGCGHGAAFHHGGEGCGVKDCKCEFYSE